MSDVKLEKMALIELLQSGNVSFVSVLTFSENFFPIHFIE